MMETERAWRVCVFPFPISYNPSQELVVASRAWFQVCPCAESDQVFRRPYLAAGIPHCKFSFVFAFVFSRLFRPATRVPVRGAGYEPVRQLLLFSRAKASQLVSLADVGKLSWNGEGQVVRDTRPVGQDCGNGKQDLLASPSIFGCRATRHDG